MSSGGPEHAYSDCSGAEKRPGKATAPAGFTRSARRDIGELLSGSRNSHRRSLHLHPRLQTRLLRWVWDASSAPNGVRFSLAFSPRLRVKSRRRDSRHAGPSGAQAGIKNGGPNRMRRIERMHKQECWDARRETRPGRAQCSWSRIRSIRVHVSSPSVLDASNAGLVARWSVLALSASPREISRSSRVRVVRRTDGARSHGREGVGALPRREPERSIRRRIGAGST